MEKRLDYAVLGQDYAPWVDILKKPVQFNTEMSKCLEAITIDQLPHSNDVSTAVKTKLKENEFVKAIIDRILGYEVRLGYQTLVLSFY